MFLLTVLRSLVIDRNRRDKRRKGAYRATYLNSIELTWFSFWRTDQWTSGTSLLVIVL